MKKFSIAIFALLAVSSLAIRVRSDEDAPSDADVEAEL
jgi:hypothetical protein